jgi:hypothetical protein
MRLALVVALWTVCAACDPALDPVMPVHKDALDGDALDEGTDDSIDDITDAIPAPPLVDAPDLCAGLAPFGLGTGTNW